MRQEVQLAHQCSIGKHKLGFFFTTLECADVCKGDWKSEAKCRQNEGWVQLVILGRLCRRPFMNPFTEYRNNKVPYLPAQLAMQDQQVSLI